jgi:hypothetical protein
MCLPYRLKVPDLQKKHTNTLVLRDGYLNAHFAWRRGLQIARTPARWIRFDFFTARSLRGGSVFIFHRAQPARWKSCFTSAAQQLRGAGF